MIGDLFVKLLIVQYVLVACAYGWQGAWYKCLYFLEIAMRRIGNVMPLFAEQRLP